MKYISTASRVALGYSGGAAAATSEGSPPQPRSPRRRRRRPSDGGRRRRGISASFYFLPPGVLLIFHPTKIQVVPDRDSPRSIWWWLSFVAGLSIWLPLSCVASLTIWPSPCLLCHPPDLLGDRPSDLGVNAMDSRPLAWQGIWLIHAHAHGWLAVHMGVGIREPLSSGLVSLPPN
jgi:hypothetical protein